MTPRTSILSKSAALALVLSVATFAQTAHTDGLAGACGDPVPTLNCTLPLVTQDFTIFVTSAFPNTPIALYVSSPVNAATDLGNNCLQWVTTDQFLFTGTTGPFGQFSITAPTSVLFPFIGVVCNGQAVLLGTGAGSVQFAGTQGWLTNGIAMTMGNPPCNCSGKPLGCNPGFCTIDKCDWGSSYGTGCSKLNYHYMSCFPNGCNVGQYQGCNTSYNSSCSGTNSWSWGGSCNWTGNTSYGGWCSWSGNNWWNNTCNTTSSHRGKRFSCSSSGLYALRSYLNSWGSSGSYYCDSYNSGSDCGGGALGREATALTLNVTMSDNGHLGTNANYHFGDLVYVNPGDSLNGMRIRDILTAINQALGGSGLPAGHTISSLQNLANNLNNSFEGCCVSYWARQFLYFAYPQ